MERAARALGHLTLEKAHAVTLTLTFTQGRQAVSVAADRVYDAIFFCHCLEEARHEPDPHTVQYHGTCLPACKTVPPQCHTF